MKYFVCRIVIRFSVLFGNGPNGEMKFNIC
jgi:hypothetical protein